VFDRTDLRAAVGAGILSADQAARLEAFLTSRKFDGHEEDTGAGGMENLRFLANFNDVFITMGLFILFLGISALLGVMAAPAMVENGFNIAAALVYLVPMAGLTVLLMEYFCKKRRLLLPSMFLTLVLTGLGAALAATVQGAMMGLEDFTEPSFTSMLKIWNFGIGSALGGLVAGILVYWRYRLPFALAVIAVLVAVVFYALTFREGNTGALIGGSAIFVMGLATLGAAIWYDMKDPERVRKASDNAFWLHLAAAPQVIYGLNGIVTGSVSSSGSGAGGITMLIALVVLGTLSLALNRRALIAASLLTFTAALSNVLDGSGFDGFSIFALVTILIGGGVVLLGAGWKTARHLILKIFPKGGLWSRLFPPELI